MLSVSGTEIEAFVGDRMVGDWLGKYRDNCRKQYAYVLCRFFKWMRVVKGLDYSPEGLIDVHLKKRSLNSVNERRWALSLVLDFVRNPEFADMSVARRKFYFVALCGFFNFYEAPLTTARGVFGKDSHSRKYHVQQIGMEQVKRILGLVHQRDRVILLIMLQSGMSVGDVLNKFSFQFDYVEACLKTDPQRLRIDISERKGNGMPYFTFISRDSIHELQKWLQLRKHIRSNSKAIFLNKHGETLRPIRFITGLHYHLHKQKMSSQPFQITSHMFRKLFKTEASIPERGIDRDSIEFMMGHLSGIQSMGNTYDRTPELYADVVEREYQKLEPFINPYTGRVAVAAEGGLNISREDADVLRVLLQKFREGKVSVAP